LPLQVHARDILSINTGCDPPFALAAGTSVSTIVKVTVAGVGFDWVNVRPATAMSFPILPSTKRSVMLWVEIDLAASS
jgi:hypothetical protein